MLLMRLSQMRRGTHILRLLGAAVLTRLLAAELDTACRELFNKSRFRYDKDSVKRRQGWRRVVKLAEDLSQNPPQQVALKFELTISSKDWAESAKSRGGKQRHDLMNGASLARQHNGG